MIRSCSPLGVAFDILDQRLQLFLLFRHLLVLLWLEATGFDVLYDGYVVPHGPCPEHVEQLRGELPRILDCRLVEAVQQIVYLSSELRLKSLPRERSEIWPVDVQSTNVFYEGLLVLVQSKLPSRSGENTLSS